MRRGGTGLKTQQPWRAPRGRRQDGRRAMPPPPYGHGSAGQAGLVHPQKSGAGNAQDVLQQRATRGATDLLEDTQARCTWRPGQGPLACWRAWAARGAADPLFLLRAHCAIPTPQMQAPPSPMDAPQDHMRAAAAATPEAPARHDAAPGAVASAARCARAMYSSLLCCKVIAMGL